jgi:hypothetical protein
MSSGIVLVRRGLLWLSALTAMAGCNEGQYRSHDAAPGRAHSAGLPVHLHAMIEDDALRIRADARRNRLWVLTLDEVRVYDTTKLHKRLIRRIALPKRSVAQFVCDPDMVLDRSGSAIISSNVEPVLWLIDADSFELQTREIRLQGKSQWETGFRALAFAADGALLATASIGRSTWKIDITTASAIMIEFDNQFPLDMCAVAARPSGYLEVGQQP